MNNPFKSQKKPIIIIFCCLALLSPLSLLLFPVKGFLFFLIYSILIGALLYGITHFLYFTFNLDIADIEYLNDENRQKFIALLSSESASRTLFIKLGMGAAIFIFALALIMKKTPLLLIEPVALLLLFLFFQNSISSNNIPVLKKKILNDNIDDNLADISMHTEESEFEKAE